MVEKSNEEDIEVVIDPSEEKDKDDIIVKKAEDVDEKSQEENDIPIEEGIAELKRKLKEETLAREAAERISNEAKKEVRSAKAEVDDTNSKLIENAINTIDGNMTILKQRMREAIKSGDADAIVDIQEEISSFSYEKAQLKQGKYAYEEKKKEVPKVSIDDPVEALASQLTSRSANWVREHPEYAKNPNLYQKMIAAHNIALADGIKTDTDEYFESVESTLKITKHKEKEIDQMSEASEKTPRKTSPPSAPVTRSAPNNSGQKSNVVTLNKEEREMADMMGMTHRDYAKNKRDLINEGKMS